MDPDQCGFGTTPCAGSRNDNSNFQVAKVLAALQFFAPKQLAIRRVDPVLPIRNGWDLQQTLAAINPGNLLSAPLSLCTVKDLLTLSGCGSDQRLRRFLDLQLRLYSQQPADQTAALYGATVLQMCQAPLGLWHLQDQCRC